jgi:hypothetical protein
VQLVAVVLVADCPAGQSSHFLLDKYFFVLVQDVYSGVHVTAALAGFITETENTCAKTHTAIRPNNAENKVFFMGFLFFIGNKGVKTLAAIRPNNAENKVFFMGSLSFLDHYMIFPPPMASRK